MLPEERTIRPAVNEHVNYLAVHIEEKCIDPPTLFQSRHSSKRWKHLKWRGADPVPELWLRKKEGNRRFGWALKTVGLLTT